MKHKGRWNRETWQHGTILNRSQRAEHPSAQKKSNVLNDKRIKFCLSRFDSGAYKSPAVSACSQPFCRRSYGVPTAAGRQHQQQQQQRGRRRGQATAAAAAATASDDCCEVYIVAPRAGFALVPCGHRHVDSIQDDDAMMTKKTFSNWSINQSNNQSLFYSAPKRCPESWPT